MPKITQYPAKTVPSNNDEFVFHEPASGSTKKMTRGDLIGGAPLPAGSVTTAALADNSVTSAALANNSVTTAALADNSVTTAKIANNSVTPAKRTGGYYAAAITLSAGTGTKTLTGFGFRPKEVQFICRSESPGTALTSIGGAVDVGGTPVSYVTATSSGPGGSVTNSGTPCMIILASTGTQLYRATFTSFNADGVTINVTTDGASYRNWFVIARA